MKIFRDALLKSLSTTDPRLARKLVLRTHSNTVDVGDRQDLIKALQNVKRV